MFKSFAASTIAGYTGAQTAIVTNFSVSTGTIQNLTNTEDVATTSVDMVYEELANGANSYTVMNQTYNMNLASGSTWSTTGDAWAQMAVCMPSEGTTV